MEQVVLVSALVGGTTGLRQASYQPEDGNASKSAESKFLIFRVMLHRSHVLFTFVRHVKKAPFEGTF